jgi:hypothetical protein
LISVGHIVCRVRQLRTFDRAPALTGAGVVAVLSAPFAWWWKVGRLRSLEEPQPPLTSHRAFVEHVVGLSGTAVCIIALSVLILATIRRTLRLRWWVVLGPALFAGGLVGDAVRVAALPIGDGMAGVGVILALIGALVLSAWSVVFCVVFAVSHDVSRRRPGQPRPARAT